MKNSVGLDTKIYNRDFYNELNKTTERSAEIIVPIVLKILCEDGQLILRHPKVCDVGCGGGIWLKVFKRYGCRIKGFDGNGYMFMGGGEIGMNLSRLIYQNRTRQTKSMILLFL